MNGADVGAGLIAKGLCQGSLIKAQGASTFWLTYVRGFEPSPETSDQAPIVRPADYWRSGNTDLGPDDYLVVVSHPCDVSKGTDREPFVEAVRAFWTRDKDIIHEARLNSGRYFPLRTRVSDDGQKEGLVADAVFRFQIAKETLLACNLEQGFDVDDSKTPGIFRTWIAERYNRPAIEDSVVRAVQKPIVDAIGRLGKTSDYSRILQSVGEIRFAVLNDAIPYQVQMLLMRDERTDAVPVSEEEVANLTGWMASLLEKGGEAVLIQCDIYDTRMISVHDYMKTVKLRLDHYTLPRDAGQRVYGSI